MVNVSIDDDRAIFELEGFDKLWAFRSRLQIPLAHITDVAANDGRVGRWWHGIKIIGAEIPGLLGVGTFYYHGEMVFWDVRDPAQTIVISLDHEHYKKLIVEVADPGRTIAQLRKAIASGQARDPGR
jgi:hypothetical protein